MDNKLSHNPHRRYNPLNGEWVLVSPHRTQRPWQGQEEENSPNIIPEYDASCYLCPGNSRAGGKTNTQYQHTHVFTNDFAALLPDILEMDDLEEGLLKATAIRGTSEVICFSPRHDLSLPEMNTSEIERVVQVWMDRTRQLGKEYLWVQVFENKGSIMGCSNPHPHGQIWAGDALPNEPLKEDQQQLKYYQENRSVLLQDYLDQELKSSERIIIENEHWVTLVPYWAVWPFETMLLPRRHFSRLSDVTPAEKQSLASIVKQHLTRYDNLFNISFPYTMGWHGAPFGNESHDHWQLHAHFYPPLLRSAKVKKFMVGYEMLSEAQRDITAEQAAERLRQVPTEHYKNVKKK